MNRTTATSTIHTAGRTAGRIAARLALVPAVALAVTVGFGSGRAAASGFDIPIDLPVPAITVPALPSIPPVTIGLPIDLPVIPLPDFPIITIPGEPSFPEIPMPDLPDFPILPEWCTHVDLGDLDVRAAQSSPDDFQWRVQIEGSTVGLCDDWFVAQMQDTATGAVQSIGFSISQVVAANDAGDDYVALLTTPCDYVTDLHFGEEYTLLAQFSGTKDCSTPAGDEPTVDSGDPVVPGDQAGADVPELDVPDFTVPGQTGQGDQPPTDGHLPHTGTSTTTFVAGGLLLLGLGLGALTIGIARRRQAV